MNGGQGWRWRTVDGHRSTPFPSFSPRPPNPCHVPPRFTLVFEPVAAITGNSGVSSATIPTAIAIHRPSRYIMRSIRPANTFWQPAGSLSLHVYPSLRFISLASFLLHPFPSFLLSVILCSYVVFSLSFTLFYILPFLHPDSPLYLFYSSFYYFFIFFSFILPFLHLV